MYVKIIDEDYAPGGEERCGRRNISMYGTRDVALNWHEHYKQHLIGIGFRQGKANPRLLSNAEKDIRAFMHGGDYVAG